MQKLLRQDVKMCCRTRGSNTDKYCMT